MSIYAKAGEKVTCVNGHHVATFTRDVWQLEEGPKPGDLEFVGQPAPEIGAPLPVCQTCGGEAFRLLGGVCHFEDGWRTA